jgi:hypothetical protein
VLFHSESLPKGAAREQSFAQKFAKKSKEAPQQFSILLELKGPKAKIRQNWVASCKLEP